MKTYRIVDATVTHDKAGVIVKQNIEYYVNGFLECVEFYSKGGIVGVEIKEGYKLQGEIEKDFIDQLTDEQLTKLADLLKPKLK